MKTSKEDPKSTKPVQAPREKTPSKDSLSSSRLMAARDIAKLRHERDRLSIEGNATDSDARASLF